MGKRLEDREAYEWIQENGISEDDEEYGELAEYDLPAFDTWRNYVSKVRTAVGERKYTSRLARPTGKSVVKSEDI